MAHKTLEGDMGNTRYTNPLPKHTFLHMEAKENRTKQTNGDKDNRIFKLLPNNFLKANTMENLQKQVFFPKDKLFFFLKSKLTNKQKNKVQDIVLPLADIL